MRWIALVLCVIVMGCASPKRYRVSLTRVNGEPMVAFEVMEAKEKR